MRLLFTFLSFIVCCAVSAQQTFRIHGKVKGLKAGVEIGLLSSEDMSSEEIATVTVQKKGEFFLEGHVDHPMLCTLTTNNLALLGDKAEKNDYKDVKWTYTPVFVENSDMTLQVSSYDELLDTPSFDAIATLADTLMDDFVDKRVDCVELIYNQFKNSLSQVLSCEQWLPIKNSSDGGETRNKTNNDYIFEPSKEVILREMIPLTLRSNFYRMVLDSLAAEHGARMTAMQKATDNATELLKDLRLSYNKARQAAITNEIIEIVSGSEALKG